MRERGYAIAPSDGSPIFFEVVGRRPDGASRTSPGVGLATLTPVVLCDGIGCDGYVWRHLIDDLGDRQVVHWHYRGHGRTPAPREAGRLSIEDCADDLCAVLDELGIARAVVAGHSMGVQVALETFRRHRGRVAGLVLACGAASHPLRTFKGASVLEDLLPRVQKVVARAPSLLNRLTRAVLPTRLAFEIATRLEINRELVELDDFMPYLQGMARMDVRLFTSMLAEAGRHSADEVLASIDVPALVIAGGRDGFTPPQRSVEMTEAIPGAEMLWIEEGSHTAPIERPEMVRAAVLDFLHLRVDSAVDRPEPVEIAG